jgi:uncharacterized membrane protein YeiH
MNLVFAFDIFGVFFFSMSGTLTAHRYQKLDLYGLGFVGLITAVGGGTVRDIILDAHPIAWVSHKGYFIAIALGYIAALLFINQIRKLARPFVTIDALAVAFAAIAGFEKSLEYGANPLAALVFGVITATVGGIIRDVICNEIPMVLRKEVYASAVLVGCSLYLSTDLLFAPAVWLSQMIGFLGIVITRLLAVRYGWNIDNKVIRNRIRNRNRASNRDRNRAGNRARNRFKSRN